MTTIKLSTATRDRLKSRARKATQPLGVVVESLLDEADRKDRFEAMRTAIAAMTPEQRESYERERDGWLDADLG